MPAIVTYGTDAAADIRATRVEEDAAAASGSTSPGRPASGSIALSLAGRFNVHNALAAVATRRGRSASIRSRSARAWAPFGASPAGWSGSTPASRSASIIDYAHSPASLEKVLGLLAPLAAARGGELIAVFGSAGERDVEKRRMMGRIAGRLARLVVATDEDPRGEDPLAILDEIARGAEDAGQRRDRDLFLIRGPAGGDRGGLRAGPARRHRAARRERATSSRSSARTGPSPTTSERPPPPRSPTWATPTSASG